MKYRVLSMMPILALCLILLTGCETRKQSIARENRYLQEHPVEKVAHYWDQVEYARAGGQTLTMDISAPEGAGPFPCLMVIHGGGWYMHTNTIMEGMSRYITNRGYVVFNINYRVIPGTDLKDIVDDCLGALIWIKENAPEYGGDPKRLGVTGDSAGGQLTAMLVTSANDPAFVPSYAGSGTTDRSITCAIPTYGVYDLVEMRKLSPPLLAIAIGKTYAQDPKLYKLLSPYYHIRKDLPPQLVMVGDQDALYPENEKYVNALKAAGAPVEFEVYPGLNHAFLNTYWGPDGTNGYDRMIKFMNEQMK